MDSPEEADMRFGLLCSHKPTPTNRSGKGQGFRDYLDFNSSEADWLHQASRSSLSPVDQSRPAYAAYLPRHENTTLRWAAP